MEHETQYLRVQHFDAAVSEAITEFPFEASHPAFREWDAEKTGHTGEVLIDVRGTGEFATYFGKIRCSEEGRVTFSPVSISSSGSGPTRTDADQIARALANAVESRMSDV